MINSFRKCLSVCCKDLYLRVISSDSCSITIALCERLEFFIMFCKWVIGSKTTFEESCEPLKCHSLCQRKCQRLFLLICKTLQFFKPVCRICNSSSESCVVQ